MIELGTIHYGASQQWLLQLVLAVIIFGVALDVRPSEFKRVLQRPKAPVAGLLAQFLLLPALTLLLTLMLDLPAGVELGMILVACCPGGAISNFMTHLAGGNTALSITMTAIGSTLAIVMMPLNFVFYSQFNPVANALLRSISVDSGAVVLSVLLVIALPLLAGFLVRARFGSLADFLHRYLRRFSILALIGFIVIAIAQNQEAFFKYFWLLMLVVLVHNALALLIGYGVARLFKVPLRDRAALTLEVGIQNSSLALAVVFTQFDGQPGMALISAFWGTWHILAGFTVALMFKRASQRVDRVNRV